MNEYLIKKLREGRLNKNYKQSDVTKLTGIKNTTLSNYENGVTEPDIDTFLQLCELYELDYAEVLGEAYGLNVQGTNFDIKPSEIEHVKKYRDLDDHGRDMVDTVLDKEHQRYKAEQESKVVPVNKFNSLLTNAANAIPGASPEDIQHDEDIMNDENF